MGFIDNYYYLLSPSEELHYYDTLPKRLLEEPMPEDPAKWHVVRLKEKLPEAPRLSR
jgi:aldehyde:ferredoxin oxidoreductase